MTARDRARRIDQAATYADAVADAAVRTVARRDLEVRIFGTAPDPDPVAVRIAAAVRPWRPLPDQEALKARIRDGVRILRDQGR